MSMSLDILTEAADMLGRQHGKQSAGWVDAFPLSAYAANNIIAGYQLEHKETLDLCPNPLSGECVDESTSLRIIDQIANLAEAAELIQADNIEEAIQQSHNILDIYERAYRKAFWEHVIETCTKIVKDK